jgi:hypothetical protein
MPCCDRRHRVWCGQEVAIVFNTLFGLEVSKLFAPGKIGYIEPGWGIDNSELLDRDSTLEVGFRWFF